MSATLFRCPTCGKICTPKEVHNSFTDGWMVQCCGWAYASFGESPVGDTEFWPEGAMALLGTAHNRDTDIVLRAL